MMKYLFFIFPGYMLYSLIQYNYRPDWGFGFLLLLEVLVVQLIATGVVLVTVRQAARPQFAAFRRICVYALVASFFAVALGFIL